MRNRIDRLWPGETIVCIASGPSLTQDDVDAVRGRARVIVVNTCYQLAPWADALYATDGRWWQHYQPRGVAEFTGLKFSLEAPATPVKPKDVRVLRNTGINGLELDPSGVRSGKNSGYSALNCAVHLGAASIVLLGYDMKPGRTKHWHPDHPWHMESPYASWVEYYKTLVRPLQELNIRVANCSRDTALNCFPRMTLQEAFSDVVSRVA